MSTWITMLDGSGTGPRVAVKDLLDVEGIPTTAGSRAVERVAKPAAEDAACLAGFRAAGARLIGKSNLHELAVLPFGVNPWFGTPENPLDKALIPGGSSSGSAVAVATGEADIAIGTDTGGSIRIPSACCGVSGLKTTFGRISTKGVWPLAPSFDSVGPIARDFAGVTQCMQLLEPGFKPKDAPAQRIGRLATTSTPEIEQAIDDALRAAGFDVVPLGMPEWQEGNGAFTTIFLCETLESDGALAEADPDGVGGDIKQLLSLAPVFAPMLEDARKQLTSWRAKLLALFDQVELLALPTLPMLPPRIDEIPEDPTPLVIDITRYTSIFNAAGTPCTAQPVPMKGSRLPTSLQLVGPHGAEELLIPTAARVEAATR
ncbi:MAG TPA: amidase [Actinomycetota bacterium]|nr:amidase [Actinomycetota bacterium]